jgi:glycosyltransferase involved in cell wall biosynthesis
MSTSDPGASATAPLKIALIAPPWFAVPPTGYGGIEWVVSILADGLTARGHEVTLFASGGSRTTARLVSCYEDPPSARLGDWLVETRHTIHAYARASGADIVHDHTLSGLATAAAFPLPVVHTVHGDVNQTLRDYYKDLPPSVHLVSISQSQCRTLPPGISAHVIHNGIDTALYPFSAKPGEYLLFVGRMNATKGVLDAIEIARRTHRRLLILAKVNEPEEAAYFESTVRPALARANVEVRFQVSHEEKAAAYREAFATLFPIHWEEPFGLVMTESMSAGTPVIAYRRGSVPEVIDHGRTGFICETIDEAVEAVSRVPDLDREACRQHVQTTFSAERNVLGHEALYRQIIAEARCAAGPPNA